MLFCITANYTPEAIRGLMANPDTNRVEAVTRLIEAADGKLVSFYSTAAEGPGVLVIFDVPDPQSAPAIGGIVSSTGAIRNVRLTRLMSPEEVKSVRHKAAKLKAAYAPPPQ
ncbi:GYD domain-containing protein [Roseomonas sp. CAU 1739]|uniref:GYD domain-containing protein n=1 Tax=Roseomonas sp. CAU 1739 TaxID=3140364 RepID=UPI00325ADCA7